MDTATTETPQEQAPDAYADKDAIKNLVKKRVEEWSKPRPRYPFLMAAERNIHYKHGNQWIVPMGNGTIGWRPVVNKRGGPLPVTNVFSSVLKTFSSLLARFEPVIHYRPATMEPEDQATADVASRVNEVVEDEVEITPIRQMLAEWVTLPGGAWLESGYDNDRRHGVVPIPMERCPACGTTQGPQAEPVCIQCQGPTTPALDQYGSPLTIAMPRGKMFAEIVSLFEMLFDPHATDPTKHRVLVRMKSLDPDEAKARWKDFADQIQADSTPYTRLTADALSQIVPNVDDGAGSARQLNNYGATGSRVTEYWYWSLPTEAYPEGLLAICLGRSQSLLVWSGPLPYYAKRADGTTDPFLPFVFFPQELVPGSAWPKTVANDVALKQKLRNQFERQIVEMAAKMANPVWTNPLGSNVRAFTGEVGHVIEFNPTMAHKPERHNGLPLNGSMIEYMDRIDESIQELANIFDVMSGNRPTGVSAGISLQILKERGESRFGPMFILWNHAWAQWSRQNIEIFRLYATEERLLRLKGRDGTWEVQKFMGADLAGRVDVVPEAGVTMPRSTMTDRAEIEQAAMLGAINVAGNHRDRLAYLRAIGKSDLFMPDMSKDTKRAFMENEAFEQLSQHPAVQAITPEAVATMKAFIQQAQLSGAGPVVALQEVERAFEGLGMAIPTVKPSIDGHAVHADEQRNFAKSERFDALHPAVQTLVELHIAGHDYLVQQALQPMVDARQGTNPGGGFMQAPGPRPGGPPSTSAMRGGSSESRMQGDQREQERRMSAVG